MTFGPGVRIKEYVTLKAVSMERRHSKREGREFKQPKVTMRLPNIFCTYFTEHFDESR